MNISKRGYVEPVNVGCPGGGMSHTVPRTEAILPNRKTMEYWVVKAFGTEYPHLANMWRFDPDAPQSWQGLQRWASRATIGLDPLPVFDGACSQSIYTVRGNGFFRAWHDYLHLAHGLSFRPEDEEAVGRHHCATLTWVHAPYAVVKAVEADTIGQTRYYWATGDFVDDQVAFVKDCLARGIDAVIEDARLQATG